MLLHASFLAKQQQDSGSSREHVGDTMENDLVDVRSLPSIPLEHSVFSSAMHDLPLPLAVFFLLFL